MIRFVRFSRKIKVKGKYMKPTTTFLSTKELIQMLCMGKSTLYDWLNQKSARFKPDFPRPIKIGNSKVVWDLSEIELWIEKQRKGE